MERGVDALSIDETHLNNTWKELSKYCESRELSLESHPRLSTVERTGCLDGVCHSGREALRERFGLEPTESSSCCFCCSCMQWSVIWLSRPGVSPPISVLDLPLNLCFCDPGVRSSTNDPDARLKSIQQLERRLQKLIEARYTFPGAISLLNVCTSIIASSPVFTESCACGDARHCKHLHPSTTQNEDPPSNTPSGEVPPPSTRHDMA